MEPHYGQKRGAYKTFWDTMYTLDTQLVGHPEYLIFFSRLPGTAELCEIRLSS